MVDHFILIEKLKYYGFDEESVSWVRNYLNDRLQASLVNGSISSLKQVEHYTEYHKDRYWVLCMLSFVVY